jgi:hypothetical protein
LEKKQTAATANAVARMIAIGWFPFGSESRHAVWIAARMWNDFPASVYQYATGHGNGFDGQGIWQINPRKPLSRAPARKLS